MELFDLCFHLENHTSSPEIMTKSVKFLFFLLKIQCFQVISIILKMSIN